MKRNVLLLKLLIFYLCPFIVFGQTNEQYPEGTLPNEFNIVGAQYPRVGKDGRTYFKIFAPDAKKVEISLLLIEQVE